jgi:hypothetical protein
MSDEEFATEQKQEVLAKLRPSWTNSRSSGPYPETLPPKKMKIVH